VGPTFLSPAHVFSDTFLCYLVDAKTVQMPHEMHDDFPYYANNGIHKGILLTRYASLIKHWSIDTRLSSPHSIKEGTPFSTLF